MKIIGKILFFENSVPRVAKFSSLCVWLFFMTECMIFTMLLDGLNINLLLKDYFKFSPVLSTCNLGHNILELYNVLV